MSKIPDTRTGREVVDITEYTVKQGEIESASQDGKQYVSVTTEQTEHEVGEETKVKTTKRISFVPAV